MFKNPPRRARTGTGNAVRTGLGGTRSERPRSTSPPPSPAVVPDVGCGRAEALQVCAGYLRDRLSRECGSVRATRTKAPPWCRGSAAHGAAPAVRKRR